MEVRPKKGREKTEENARVSYVVTAVVAGCGNILHPFMDGYT